MLLLLYVGMAEGALIALLLGGAVFAADEELKEAFDQKEEGFRLKKQGEISQQIFEGRWDIYRDTFVMIGARRSRAWGGQFRTPIHSISSIRLVRLAVGMSTRRVAGSGWLREGVFMA